ncbi:MAG: UUP1 family membrane protein, partial [Methylophagaceae bacterium]
MKNLHVKLLALALLIFASSLIFYKVSTLGLPLFPSDDIEVWSIEARLAFTAKKGPLKAQLILPSISPGYMIIDENYVSGKYGLAVTTVGNNRVAEWAVRRARGEQVLYYHLQLTRDGGDANQPISEKEKSIVGAPNAPQYPENTATAITALLEEVRQKSADVKTFTRELLLRFNSETPDENVQLLLRDVNTVNERVELIRLVLAGARIPSRTVNVLFLREGARHSKLIPWLQVHNEQEWLSFNPDNSESELPDNVLIWDNTEHAIFNVDGGKNSSLDFAISRHTQEPIRLAEQRAREMDSRA